jgi:capsular exopolysaccharide synthesis family protein
MAKLGTSRRGGRLTDEVEAPRRDLDLQDLWRIVQERRLLILFCLAGALILASVFSFLSTPLYQATTTLQVQRYDPDVLTFKEVVGVDPSWAAYSDFYRTQYEILHSRTVLRRAARQIDLVNRPEFVNPKRSPLSWLRSRLFGLFAGKASRGEPREEDRENAAVGLIAGGLTIRPLKESQLVEVSFASPSPELARDVANAVADAYLFLNLQNRFTTTKDAQRFLNLEVKRLEEELRDLEEVYQDATKENLTLALNDNTQDISETALAELHARLIQARGDLALAQARIEALAGASADALPEVLNSPLIGSLRERYAELERRRSLLSERFQPGWPELAQLEEEMAQARARLVLEKEQILRQVREVADSRYQLASAEVDRLEEQVEAQEKVVRAVNRDALEYQSMKAEIDIRREVLDGLIARQSQMETSAQLRSLDDDEVAITAASGNVRVVDAAELPRAPFRPRKVLNLFMAFPLGLGLGLGLTFLLYYLDNTVKDEEEIDRQTGGLALLGQIPLFRPVQLVGRERSSEPEKEVAPQLVSHLTPRSVVADAFKNVRTSLLLASPDRPPRRIMITSCLPGDGKSTVAVNLATVLAQKGQRVLLIDADLRRPTLHQVLGVDNARGLSSFLSGNEELDELIRPTQIPGVDLITSGPMPPNPSELLDSPGLRVLLELGAEGQYDHLVFDAPPAVQVADSVVLATRMEATALVVRLGVTTRDALAQGVARLRQGRARLVGVIVNGLTSRSRSFYDAYSHYQPGDGSAAEGTTEAPPKRSRWRRRRASQG